MTKTKKIIIKRIDVAHILGKERKGINIPEILELARKVKIAVAKEEKIYGKFQPA